MVRQPRVRTFGVFLLTSKAYGLHWLAHRRYGTFDADEAEVRDLLDQFTLVAVHATNNHTTYDGALYASADYRQKCHWWTTGK